MSETGKYSSHAKCVSVRIKCKHYDLFGSVNAKTELQLN